MPPLNLRKGMHCFFSNTSPRYFWAFLSVRPLMACAHSYVFLKCTRRSTPMALQALLGLLGSREYLTIAPLVQGEAAGGEALGCPAG